jgi:hypothetical protein
MWDGGGGGGGGGDDDDDDEWIDVYNVDLIISVDEAKF